MDSCFGRVRSHRSRPLKKASSVKCTFMNLKCICCRLSVNDRILYCLVKIIFSRSTFISSSKFIRKMIKICRYFTFALFSMLYAPPYPHCIILTVQYVKMRSRYAMPNLCWVFCKFLGVLCNLSARFCWDCIYVARNLPRFEMLAHFLLHFDALSHVVNRVSSAFIFQTSAEVWYFVFVKFSSFRSFKVFWIFAFLSLKTLQKKGIDN